MYFLGLFTSHIPYIVIIAVYAVYFLTYSVNKLNLSWKSDSPEVIENHKIISDAEMNGKRVVHYDPFSEDVSADTPDNPPVTLHVQGLILNRLIPPAQIVPPSCFGHIFIPRPPPYMV
jgi:hypothetical protein